MGGGCVCGHRKKLYTELLFAIGLVFGMTFFLETSSLFPTIVAANKQFKSAKTKMVRGAPAKSCLMESEHNVLQLYVYLEWVNGYNVTL